MRKIRVCGRVNCPYEKGFICNHPSFNSKNRGLPIPEQYFNEVEGALPITGYVPDWCPLDVDPIFYPCPTCPTC